MNRLLSDHLLLHHLLFYILLFYISSVNYIYIFYVLKTWIVRLFRLLYCFPLLYFLLYVQLYFHLVSYVQLGIQSWNVVELEVLVCRAQYRTTSKIRGIIFFFRILHCSLVVGIILFLDFLVERGFSIVISSKLIDDSSEESALLLLFSRFGGTIARLARSGSDSVLARIATGPWIGRGGSHGSMDGLLSLLGTLVGNMPVALTCVTLRVGRDDMNFPSVLKQSSNLHGFSSPMGCGL
jgi:hypothetical protein